MLKQIFLNDINEFLITSSPKKINISYSDYEDFQYQSPILLSNPSIDKNELISFLLNKNYYEDVQVTGKGFLSVKFKLSTLNKFQPTIAKKNKIIVDYCGVNVAKKMHIGHIRSMFIGDYISRLHEHLGDKVIRFNHIGDWGNQFGYLLNYIIKNNLDDNLNNDELTNIYKKANLLNKENLKFSKESDSVAHKLQHHLDDNIYNLWKKCVSISLNDAANIFKKLNIKLSLNDTQGESFYAPMCQSILDDLILKGIAKKESDNSVVAFIDNNPIVLQKNNGNFLYGLYDIAAIKWRIDNINPDKIIYVVDNRQSLHFTQVFKIAQLAGYSTHTELSHIGFGTILGKDKKPLKTKEGESLYLEDLLAQGESILASNDYFNKIDEPFKSEILNKSIIGGMKFYDLKFNKNQDYIFDWNNVLNFSGGSAPYIQNAMVRIDSIFYKLNIDISLNPPIDFSYHWNNQEKQIIFQIFKCNEIITDSHKDYMSQSLAENIIKLCQLFHNYYESSIIIGSDEQDKKINLISNIYHSLKENINILGIESYDCKQKMELNLAKKNSLI